MAEGRSHRRVATVVFVDVVDSTRVASEVGDARWRELLGAFRSIVRRQLKQFNGHEVDTAGDGFFAWFDSPANAIRAAVAICTEVQERGLDVRCGLHTGELEQIDGRLGGIAAHIGARVMAAAGPAQVLATSTVRDLVTGGAATFESVGEHELKGVPGNWPLHRVITIDGHQVAAPLEPEEAEKRRSAASAAVKSRRALGLAAVAASVVVFGLLLVSAYGLFGFGRTASATLAPTQRPSPSPPLSMVAIDPATNTVTAEIRDDHSRSGANRLLAFHGNLFQAYDLANKLVQRDLSTGQFNKETDLASSGCCRIQQGAAGSIWRAYGQPVAAIDQIDPTSGNVIKTLHPGIKMVDFAVSDTSVYILGQDNVIHEINPITGQDTTFPSLASTPTEIWYADGNLYFPDGKSGDPKRALTEIDATTHLLENRWTGLSNWGLNSPAGAIDPTSGRLWLTNPQFNTVTSLKSGETAPGNSTSLGPLSQPHDIALGFGAIWVAGGENVFRIGEDNQSVLETIAMPPGADATSIAIDTADGKIWVSNCHGPGC